MKTSARYRETPLSRDLRQKARSRATPRDAFAVALRKWENGERIEIGAVAEELGVNRATVFRWVGSRELLIGEVIWQRFAAIFQYVSAASEGVGADYAADFTRKLIKAVLDSRQLRTFIEQDPEYALRLLTSKTSTVQARIIEAVCGLLRSHAVAGHIEPALAVEDLAYAIVRMVESCLYSDQITGRIPNVEVTAEVIRILVAARPNARMQRQGAPKRARTKQRAR